MTLVSEHQLSELLIEASLAYIKNPTPEGKNEVSYYAELVLLLPKS